MIYLAITIGGLGCLWLYKQWIKQARLPPGPKGWPFVGNAFQQDSVSPHITWSKWAKDFGDVCTINIFGTPIVLCNSPEAVKEMLVTKSTDFSGRPDVYHLKYMTNGCKDVILGDFDSHWAYKKKVFSKGIKMYGDGLERLESIMIDIITELIDEFQKTNQQPTDPLRPIQLALCNTLALLLTGDKFQLTDSDFLKLLEYIDMDDALAAPSFDAFLVDALPLLHYLPLPFCKILNDYVDGFIKEWIPRIIQKRMASYDENSPGCILDAFILQEKSHSKSSSQILIDMEDIIGFCQDVFTAGIQTSSGAFYNILAILTAKPDIQAKLQGEIDPVLGGRQPKLQDRQFMPYFQAMLEEVFRYAVIINGFPHKATTNSTICGHFIPKDTQVWANVWHLCHDPLIWEDPWEFKPERFLDDEGEFVSPDHPARKNVLIFGAGHRVCPGEQLARNRIFLILTSLLQNFVFKPAADDQLPQCDPRLYPEGFVLQPQPYKVRIIPRELHTA